MPRKPKGQTTEAPEPSPISQWTEHTSGLVNLILHPYLFDTILSYVDGGSLSTLMRLSRSFYDRVAPKVYKQVDLSDRHTASLFVFHCDYKTHDTKERPLIPAIPGPRLQETMKHVDVVTMGNHRHGDKTFPEEANIKSACMSEIRIVHAPQVEFCSKSTCPILQFCQADTLITRITPLEWLHTGRSRQTVQVPVRIRRLCIELLETSQKSVLQLAPNWKLPLRAYGRLHDARYISGALEQLVFICSKRLSPKAVPYIYTLGDIWNIFAQAITVACLGNAPQIHIVGIESIIAKRLEKDIPFITEDNKEAMIQGELKAMLKAKSTWNDPDASKVWSKITFMSYGEYIASRSSDDEIPEAEIRKWMKRSRRQIKAEVSSA